MSKIHLPLHSSPDRRSILAGLGAFGGSLLLADPQGRADVSTPGIKVEARTIEVNGKPAKVFHIAGPGGRAGILASEGDRFRGSVLNASGEPLQLHWHGQTEAPFDQDRARPGGGSIPVGGSETYDFVLTPGTHWMHSHTLSEQQLLAAPMIAREKAADDVQDVVVMLHDFSFRSPEEILAGLGGTSGHHSHGQPVASDVARSGSGSGSHSGSPGHGHKPGMAHANDVAYDAYLANDRTLDDPEIVKVSKGGRARIRIINGATATAFFVSTPGLRSECIAVDGTPCRPLVATSYALAQGQRIDLIVTIPSAGGAFPVLAAVEAARFQTGVILATPGASVVRRPTAAASPRPLVDARLDAELRAASPLPARTPDKRFTLKLGEEGAYRWTINGRVHGEHQPLAASVGDRVEITFENPSSMMHPMHLHGHHFQVVAISGRRLNGPVRDTVVVPVRTPVTIAFDARQRGDWYLHCHHLYHMASGMMTELRVA
jgi:FtsP/CotA-like multicopper oxidase with cupredoxin domain